MCHDIITGRLGRACETQQNQVQVRLLCGSTQLFVGFRFTLPNLLARDVMAHFFVNDVVATQQLFRPLV